MAVPQGEAHSVLAIARGFSLEDNGKERRLSFATDDIESAKRYQEAGLRVLCCVMEESHQGLVPVHGFTAARRGSSERA
jgi:hypothetical protein